MESNFKPLMNKINLIDLNIYEFNIESIDNELICKQIEQYGSFVGNSGEYLSDTTHTYFEDTLLPISDEILKLENNIVKCVEAVAEKSYKISSIWALELTMGQSVMMHSHKSNHHTHPEEYYSVAYYPRADENSASLIFSVDYANTMEVLKHITPVPGKLVVFNSYLSHMTSRNFSKDPRIVISANLEPLDKNYQPTQDWSLYHNRPIVPTE